MKRVIIITGTRKGIGHFLAEKYLSEGDIVYGCSRRECEINHENYHHIRLDVSDEPAVIAFVRNVYREQKRIDILINNAGISQIKEFTQITDQDWNNMINTNLNSVFYMTQEACFNMIHNKQGCIINISSIWGITGASCEVHYSVSKAGVDALTKSLAKELGPSNIRINSIAPGIINTEMNSHLTPEELEELKEEIPLEKIGKTQDIERCVEWLIEDEYTTGQIISINGGWNI